MNKLPRIIAAMLLPLASTVASAEDLNEVYVLAVESDPVLQAERAAYEASTFSERQAKARYLPNVNFSASHTNTDSENNITSTTSDYTSKSYSLSLRQALYRRDYMTQWNAAEAATQQAEAQLNAAEQTLITRVAQRYFEVLAAQDSLEFAQAEMKAIERQLEQTKQRFEVGLIAITDVHESQAAYDLATASEIVARNQLAISHQALREVTGQLPEKLHTLGKQMELISPDPADINAWVEGALKQNYEILAAEAAVEAAKQSLAESRSGRHPTLDLVASRSHSDNGSLSTVDSDNTSLGIELNIPIYLGGSIGAGISKSRAQLTQATQALEQQRRTIQRQVSEAYLGVLASISRVKALNQAVTSSNSALKATEAGYDVGTRTTVDVLNARRELYRAQRDYARARYDYILASLSLKKAAGLLSSKDLQQINQWLTPAS